MARFVPSAVNLIVSNVQGPTSLLRVADRRVESIYSVGPVLEGIGLNITAWSYLDELSIGVLACRAMVPEPSRIALGMRDALDDLVARARATSRRDAPPID